MSSPYKTFSCITYGCKVNFADSSSISRQLTDLGYSLISNDQLADIYIINTCSVTDMADKKAQKIIFGTDPSKDGQILEERKN